MHIVDPPEALMSPRLSRFDRLGMLISSICLVHCLALPLLVAMLPLMGQLLPSDQIVHEMLIGIALPVTGFALFRGWRAHRSIRPALLGVAGMLLVAMALLVSEEHHGLVEALTLAGGLLVSGAHLLNWRHAKHCAGDGHGH